MKRDAVIDKSEKYRYLLTREWDISKQQITFIMLNPSIADGNQDDPTIRRCINFATAWDYGSLEVVNLFAYRATKPRDICKVADPVGVENDYYLQESTQRAALIIVAWGCNVRNVSVVGKYKNRDTEVKTLIHSTKTLYCLGLTKYGYPRHPLFIKNGTQPIRF